MKKEKSSPKRYPMKDFGTVLGDTQSIRINRLENRLTPLVPFPHRHSFYHLLVMTAGSGWHEIDFVRYSVSPDQIYCMAPGQVHSWQLSSNTRGYVIEFESNSITSQDMDQKLIRPLLQHAHAQTDLSRVSPDSRKRISQILELMIEEYETQRPHFEVYLKHLLTVLLLDFLRLGVASTRRAQDSDPCLEKFLSLVEQSFRKDHRVSFYAQQMKLTEKALTMRVSRALGKSARTIIQDRCLLESKRLLAYSNLSIHEIAFELGFEDPNYFSRFFKSKTRQSPGSFRLQVRNFS
jgi:AraC family transcriptional regulator, transcriptional activator of pobA